MTVPVQPPRKFTKDKIEARDIEKNQKPITSKLWLYRDS